MGIAYKCDACGKLYEPYGISITEGGNKYNEVCLIAAGRVNSLYYDVCPDCMKKVIAILENEKDEVKTCRTCKWIRNNDDRCIAGSNVHHNCVDHSEWEEAEPSDE